MKLEDLKDGMTISETDWNILFNKIKYTHKTHTSAWDIMGLQSAWITRQFNETESSPHELENQPTIKFFVQK